MKRELSQEWLDDKIDKGLQYAIYHLNRKGYMTDVCCEGHYADVINRYSDGYIRFMERIPDELCFHSDMFILRPKEIIRSKMRDAYYEIEDSCDTIRWVGNNWKRNMPIEKKEEEHRRFLDEVNRWVDSLPEKPDEPADEFFRLDTNELIKELVQLYANPVEVYSTLGMWEDRPERIGDWDFDTINQYHVEALALIEIGVYPATFLTLGEAKQRKKLSEHNLNFDDFKNFIHVSDCFFHLAEKNTYGPYMWCEMRKLKDEYPLLAAKGIHSMEVGDRTIVAKVFE